MITQHRQRILYIISDLIMTSIAILIFDIMRYDMLGSGWLGFSSVTDFLVSTKVIILQVGAPLMMLGIYWITGYYNDVIYKSRLGELASTVACGILGAIIVISLTIIDDVEFDSRPIYVLCGVLALALSIGVYIPRFILTSITTRRIRRGDISFGTVIVGDCRDEEQIRRQISSVNRSTGIRICAVINTDDSVSPTSIGGIDVAPLDRISEIVEELDIKNIIIVPQADGFGSTMKVINRVLPLMRNVYMSVTDNVMLATRTRQLNIASEPMIDITRSDISASTRNIKRTLDVGVSILAIAMLLVPTAVIAIMIKMDSKGPVFYRQTRMGYRGRPFRIIKFRTMCTDAEADGVPRLSSANDSRTTRVGRFLRKYRLDELPQFVNVLRGDMSIVGPRPEREYYVRQIVQRAPQYLLLRQVRPGITSWGMVKYGYATDVSQMVERMRYDLLYLENMSLFVDLKIVIHTIHTVLTGKGI